MAEPQCRGTLRAVGLSAALGLLIFAATSVGEPPIANAAQTQDFQEWLAELRVEALDRGVSQSTVDMALGDLEPLDRVLALDRSQPKKPTEFCEYMRLRLSSTRIARGRRALDEQAPLLRELRAKYGIPERYLVAVWGLETNFGDYLGDYPVIASLATLAYDPRRASTFRKQLLAALQIVDEGHVELDAFRGSWAGAMGQVQFMPTTFLGYAVDHDGDGRKDIWTNVGDALASAANYLSRSGWHRGLIWGRPVKIPAEFAARPPTGSKKLAEWQRRGVRKSDGSDLPNANLSGSLVLPRGGLEPAFLVYANYGTFLRWNRSTFFGISLGALSDRVSEIDATPICGY